MNLIDVYASILRPAIANIRAGIARLFERLTSIGQDKTVPRSQVAQQNTEAPDVGTPLVSRNVVQSDEPKADEPEVKTDSVTVSVPANLPESGQPLYERLKYDDYFIGLGLQDLAKHIESTTGMTSEGFEQMIQMTKVGTALLDVIDPGRQNEFAAENLRCNLVGQSFRYDMPGEHAILCIMIDKLLEDGVGIGFNGLDLDMTLISTVDPIDEMRTANNVKNKSLSGFYDEERTPFLIDSLRSQGHEKLAQTLEELQADDKEKSRLAEIIHYLVSDSKRIDAAAKPAVVRGEPLRGFEPYTIDAKQYREFAERANK